MDTQTIVQEQEMRYAKLIKLLVVEDHPIVRLGIEMLFEYLEDVFIVGEADSVSEALHLIPALKPDVVLLDIEVPGVSGINAVATIKDRHPKTAIVALSFQKDHIYTEKLLSVGACRHVSKCADPKEVISAVRVAGNAVIAQLLLS
jgi:DNA-binding NarL/FixJ family response regulator